MSLILPPARRIPHWLTSLLERDFCPAMEPYVAWLRQPVGWFGVATLASVVVGFTVAPLALSIAAGLLALLVIGLAYPWLAVRLADCELNSPLHQLSEDEACEVQVRVRNGCPWPLCGMIIEGFVVSPIDPVHDRDDRQPSADIALGCVPWLSQATYRLSMTPRLRGHYPAQAPQLTCSFPFGIWTARRTIRNAAPLTVHPKQVKLTGMLEQPGRAAYHGGHGARAGNQGDFLGLREYRLGDSIRQIHWAHTARLDKLIVCERSAAEQAPWRIHLTTTNSQPGSMAARENLAWRVRIAASLCTLFDQQSLPFTLTMDDQQDLPHRPRSAYEDSRLQQAIATLTDIPLDGRPEPRNPNACNIDEHADACLSIEAVHSRGAHSEADPNADIYGHREPASHHLIRLRLHKSTGSWRQAATKHELIVDLYQPIASQINAWLQKLSHERQAA